MKSKKVFSYLLIGALSASLFAQAVGQRTGTVLAVDQNLQNQIDSLEDRTDSLQSEISELDSELVSLLTQINTLEMNISDNEAQIETTSYELEAAQEAVSNQYGDMKTRIKYMYETGNESALAILLESGSIADFLNRVEYVTSVYDYDRELLDAYTATQTEIQQMKLNLEQAQMEMEAEKSELSAKEASLDALIESKKDELDNFEEQLAAAKAEAERQAEEARQREMIAAVQRLAAQRAAEEEARQRAAAAAAAAAAARNNSTAAASTGAASSGTGSTASGGSTGSSTGSGASGSTPSDDTFSANPAPVTNISGSAVVSYAQQFVGNPYVWGGNSLTNGCDCSGFVHLVYQHFGVSTPRDSYSFRSAGQAVSYDNIQPGDIVCYAGHVAIYAGGGIIVEAMDSAHGITCYRSVTCNKILAIRRVI